MSWSNRVIQWYTTGRPSIDGKSRWRWINLLEIGITDALCGEEVPWSTELYPSRTSYRLKTISHRHPWPTNTSRHKCLSYCSQSTWSNTRSQELTFILFFYRMKYLYLIVWSILLIMMLIIFFQSIIRYQNPVPFLSQSKGIALSMFVLRSFIISFASWALLALWIKGIFSNYTDQNEWFDL